jgi:hypothetical protein
MEKTMYTVISEIFPLIILVVFFIVFIYSNNKKKEALKKLSGFLTGGVPGFIFLPTFNGVYQGFKFSIVLIPAGKNSPAYLKISLFKASSLRLSIYKESILSNLGKKIGVIHEVKINDEAFDKEFFVFSNKPNEAMFYINNASIKEAIRGLFNAGFESISINGKLVLIQKPNYTLESDLEAQNVISILQKLIHIARALL